MRSALCLRRLSFARVARPVTWRHCASTTVPSPSGTGQQSHLETMRAGKPEGGFPRLPPGGRVLQTQLSAARRGHTRLTSPASRGRWPRAGTRHGTPMPVETSPAVPLVPRELFCHSVSRPLSSGGLGEHADAPGVPCARRRLLPCLACRRALCTCRGAEQSRGISVHCPPLCVRQRLWELGSGQTKALSPRWPLASGLDFLCFPGSSRLVSRGQLRRLIAAPQGENNIHSLMPHNPC